MNAGREEQIRDLFPVVRTIARRVLRLIPGSDFDDLIGDGSIGLIRAVDAFDPAHGVSLENYARRIILGAMLNGIRRLDPVSERVRRTIRYAERERYAIAAETGKLPTMAAMEKTRPVLQRARAEAHRGSPLSLDSPLPVGEKVMMLRDGDPAGIILGQHERARIRSAVTALPPRQRALIVAHYYEDRSLRSLSKSFTISPQRASQLHIAAIARLRKQLAVPA